MQGTILVFDADNTLWETDKLYRDAQLALLGSILNELGVVDLGHGKPLSLVRRIDQGIAEAHADGLKYPAELLVDSLIVHLGFCADSIHSEAKQTIVSCYYSNLSKLPGLRRGVKSTFLSLHDMGISPYIFTESSAGSVQRRLKEHQLDRYVCEVISGSKTPAKYAELCVRFAGDRVVMVGDQLDRDIKNANGVGWFSIYYPGRFKNKWTRGLGCIVEPDFTVRSLSEILDSPPLMALSSKS